MAAPKVDWDKCTTGAITPLHNYIETITDSLTMHMEGKIFLMFNQNNQQPVASIYLDKFTTLLQLYN